MTPRVWIFAIVRAIVTIGIISAVIYQEIMGATSSNTLQQTATLIIGFYFGAEANAVVSDHNRDRRDD